MAAVNFLFGSRTPSGFSLSGIVDFEADLTLEESHERIAEVTEHPIESGAVVSDHVILAPERLRLEGFVTDAPPGTGDAGRTQGAFETLEQAWRERQPMTVVTGRKTYQNMIIVRLDMPKTRPTSMRFQIELQAVTIVNAQDAVLAGPEPGGVGAGAAGAGTGPGAGVDSQASGDPDLTQPESDAGRQATRPASEATETRSSTIYEILY